MEEHFHLPKYSSQTTLDFDDISDDEVNFFSQFYQW